MTKFLSLLFLLAVVPAFAAPTVTRPVANQEVTSPFTLSASAQTCNSQSVVAMGYSLDDSSNTTIIHSNTVDALVIAGTGVHTLHVKSWGSHGAACSTPVPIDVQTELTLPSSATVVSNVQRLTTWVGNHDAGTSGSSSGATQLAVTPSLSGQARQFTMEFDGYGGQIFHVVLGRDPDAEHFIYDAQVYFTSLEDVANVEMDMNQVMSNGQTVIYGFQCDGYSSTWDYSVNTGTAAVPKGKWEHTGAYCNPREWSANTWHHIQIAYERDANGRITYQTVIFDGTAYDLGNAVGNSAYSLGWSVGTLLTNFQIDGLGVAGSATAYVDDLTVYRW